MKMFVKNDDNEKEIKVFHKEGSVFHVAIGEKKYQLDVEKVEDGVYSVLYNGRCINMEIIETETLGHYKVNTLHEHFNIEVFPASSVLAVGKKKQDVIQRLTSPMPGKIVKINAKKGEMVQEGSSLIILSAMKMENEFKSTISGIVNRIDVKNGDVVREGQFLMEIKANMKD